MELTSPFEPLELNSGSKTVKMNTQIHTRFSSFKVVLGLWTQLLVLKAKKSGTKTQFIFKLGGLLDLKSQILVQIRTMFRSLLKQVMFYPIP